MNVILELLNIITSSTMRKSSFLKKRVFGNYEYLTKAKYHGFMIISCIIDFMLIFLMCLLFLLQLNTYLTILVLSLAIIFVTFIIYNLLFYPRAYLKYKQPECFYYDNNSYRKGIIVNIFKNKVLIRDNNNYKDEYLHLIDLSKIIYIHKYNPDNINTSQYENKCSKRYLKKVNKKIKTLNKAVKKLNKLVNDINKNCYSHCHKN